MKAHKALKGKLIRARGGMTANEYLRIQAVGAIGCRKVFS